jgi:hypothetical protein
MTVRMTSPSTSSCAASGVRISSARTEAVIVMRVCRHGYRLSSFNFESLLPMLAKDTMLLEVTSSERLSITAAQSGLLALGLLLLP